jgi:hypothetical protein
MQASADIVMDRPDPVTGQIRVPFTLTPRQLAAVDGFRYDKGMPSRATAMRELLRRGLVTQGLLKGEPK